MKKIYTTLVFAAFLVLCLLPFQCDLLDNDEETKEPGLEDLTALITFDVPEFFEIASVAKPPGSIKRDEAITGGYAIRELFTLDTSQYLFEMIMNYGEKDSALAYFNTLNDSLKIGTPYLFGDKAFIASEINRKNVIGCRLFSFVRNQFMVVLGTGTLDSTLASPDSILLLTTAKDIDDAILEAGFKNVSFPTFGNRRAIYNLEPAASTEATTRSVAESNDLLAETLVKVPLVQKNREAGWIQLKLTNEKVGDCPERFCPPGNPPEYIHCALRKIKIEFVDMYLDEDADDTDNIPIFDEDAEIYAGINLWVYFDCEQGNTQVQSVIGMKCGMLGSIDEGESLEPSTQIPKDLIDVTDCQCDTHPEQPNVGFTITAYIYDDQSAPASQLLAEGEKAVAAFVAPGPAQALQAAANIKLALAATPPTGGGPDPYEGVKGVDYIGKCQLTARTVIPR